jgi:hypothetical protein
MKQATPQRTVNISLMGRLQQDVRIAYSFWSPNDGFTRTAAPDCNLYQPNATNTLFILDYGSTLDGWTILRIEPNPAGAPMPETIHGPAHMSIMTMFPYSDKPEEYKFYIVYKNKLTDEEVRFDPQERNVP